MGNAESVFATLANHETQLAGHDQSIQPPAGNAENVFSQIAANNGKPPETAGTTESEQAGFGHRFLEGAGLPTETPKPPQSFKELALMAVAPAVEAYHKAKAPVEHAEKLVDAIKKGDGEAAAMHLGNFLDSFVPGTGNAMQLSQESGKDLESGNVAGLAGTATGLATRVALAKGATKVPGAGEAEAAEVGAAKPGIFKSVRQGEKVAQEPAKSAVRATVGAEDEAKLLEGNKTVVDEHLKGIAAKEKAAYEVQDKAAGFDVKETRAKLKDAEWKVKQPEIDEATRERLSKTITESKQSIANAEGKLKEAGINPKEADTLHQQRMAGQDFKKALIQHVSPDGESVNVDGLLNASKKLRFSKYGDRLEQFMGKEGAEKYMTELQKAQESGVHALKVRELGKTALKALGRLGAIGTGAGAIAHVLKE